VDEVHAGSFGCTPGLRQNSIYFALIDRLLLLLKARHQQLAERLAQRVVLNPSFDPCDPSDLNSESFYADRRLSAA
jgi:hypothetical protein